jgi:hypothetical protein
MVEKTEAELSLIRKKLSELKSLFHIYGTYRTNSLAANMSNDIIVL